MGSGGVQDTRCARERGRSREFVMLENKASVVLIALALAIVASPCFSAGNSASSELLTADQAFNVDGKRLKDDQVAITVNAAQGYAVYKERLKVTSESLDGKALRVKFPKPQAAISMPDGTVLHKYKGQNEFLVSLPRQAGTHALVVEIQGCAEVGVCYQPMQKRIVLR